MWAYDRRLACSVFGLLVLSAPESLAKPHWHPPVDPRIAEAFGRAGVAALQDPREVEVLRISVPYLDELDHRPPAKETLHGYAVRGRAETQHGEAAAKLGALFLSDRIYDLPKPGTGMFKLCGFEPGIALRFRPRASRRQSQPIDVLICLHCNELEVISPAGTRGSKVPSTMLEVDPGRDALLSMAEELFPDESLWRQLRTEDARQTYAERRADEELHPELRRALAEHTSFHDLKRVPTRLHAPPDQIARSLFRVLGARSDGYEGESLETQVLFDVAAGLTPAELIDALKRLRGDRLALLGAARLWFHERFAEKLPPDVVSEWPAVLARVVVEDGAHRNKPQVIFGLRRWASSSGAMDFLHRLARGEISEQTGRYESPARAVAFFTLAMLKDSTLNDQLKRYQPQEDQNRLLLDVTRALEGEPDRLVAAVFQSDSEYVAMGATEAVRRYGGTAGMDVLVQYGLHQHDWYWHELSVRAFAEVVKADWAAPAPGKDWPSQQAVTKAIEDWWKGHGEDFKRRHPLKASAPLDP